MRSVQGGAPTGHPRLGVGQHLLGPLPVRPVVVREDRRADGHRLDAPRPQAGDEFEVAEGLGHLLAVQGHHAGVRVGVRERQAVDGGGVRGGELVVREPQVGAAALHRERRRQVGPGDHGALDVPAGPAGAERPTVPGRLALAVHAPQQRVQRVALAGAVGIASPLREHRGHLVQAHRGDLSEAPVGRGLGRADVEVDVPVGLAVAARHAVGPARRQHRLDGVHHQAHRLGRADVVVRGEHLEGGHVRTEQVGLLLGERAPVDAGRLGPLEQGVVHVGHVLDVGDLETGRAPVAVQQVEGHIGARVAEMRRVVRGDPADVQRGALRVVARMPSPSRGGVVQPQPVGAARHGGRGGGAPGLHGTPQIGVVRRCRAAMPGGGSGLRR